MSVSAVSSPVIYRFLSSEPSPFSSISPGCGGNRVGFLSNRHVVVANGCNLFDVSLPSSTLASTRQMIGHIPCYPQHFNSVSPLLHHSHESEIQNLSMAEMSCNSYGIGSVDCNGDVVVSVMATQDTSDTVSDDIPSKRQKIATEKLIVRNVTKLPFAMLDSDSEAGESNICLRMNQASSLSVAVCKEYSRMVCLYTNYDFIRSFRCWNSPSSLSYISVPTDGVFFSGKSGVGCGSASSSLEQKQSIGISGSLLAVAESNYLSLWDERVAEMGGCIARLSVSAAPLRSVYQGSTSTIAVSGTDRTVRVFDIRTLTLRGTWSSPCRTDVNYMYFPKSSPSTVVVGGRAGEIAAGKWQNIIPRKPRQHARGASTEGVPAEPSPAVEQKSRPAFENMFQTDGRMIGMCGGEMDGYGEVIVGLSEASSIYVMQQSWVLSEGASHEIDY